MKIKAEIDQLCPYPLVPCENDVINSVLKYFISKSSVANFVEHILLANFIYLTVSLSFKIAYDVLLSVKTKL